MTQADADQIQQAALVLLHAVKDAGLASAHVHAALNKLAVHDNHRAWISLRRAREILEATPAWNATTE